MACMTLSDKSLHSICRWTFNPGKGGFVPGDMRPEWGGKFGTPRMIKSTTDKIRPQTPDSIELDIEMHYDGNIDDKTAFKVAMMQINSLRHFECGAPSRMDRCPDTLIPLDGAQAHEQAPRPTRRFSLRHVVFVIGVFLLLLTIGRMLYPTMLTFDEISFAPLGLGLLCIVCFFVPKRAWRRIKHTVKSVTLKTGILDIKVGKDKTSEGNSKTRH